MDTSEQELRREAMRRRVQGERRYDLCRDLGHSPRWFRKWWAEYQRHPPTDFGDHSRAPHPSPHRMPLDLEQAVVTMRQVFADTPQTPYGLIGHRAIRAERERLQVRPWPSLATIQRLLARHELTQARGAAHDTAADPGPVAGAPDAMHATDMMTRHLRGGEVVQHVHPFDQDSHAVPLSQHAHQTAAPPRAHLLDTWAQGGLPTMPQCDNADACCGGPTHPRVLGQVGRLCLVVGVEVVFSPFYEPDRNSWVEVTAFWSRPQFGSRADVPAEAPTFWEWYHPRAQPPSLAGKTPAHRRRGFRPFRLTTELRRLIPEPPPITAGRLHFLRKVDTTGHISLLNEPWSVGQKGVGPYGWAMGETGNQRLIVWHKAQAEAPWQRIKTRLFRLHEPVHPLLLPFRRKCARCRAQWPS